MTEKVKIDIELSDEFLQDVMVQVIETSAITYWAEMFEVAEPTYSTVTIRDMIEQDDGTHVELRFTKEAIARGITRVLDPSFRVRESIRAAIYKGAVDSDGGEIDIEAADVIVQAAMFGEIIYG